MDSWYVALIEWAPDISTWPLFAQAGVTVAAMLGAVVMVGLLLWGLSVLLSSLIKVKMLSPGVGVVGYLVLTFFAWTVWVFLPWAISGSLVIETDGDKLLQSLWIFFSLFLLVNLLAKDALEDLDQWANDSLGTPGRLYQTALLVLPLGVPLITQLRRLKAFQRRKERYLAALQAIRDEHA